MNTTPTYKIWLKEQSMDHLFLLVSNSLKSQVRMSSSYGVQITSEFMSSANTCVLAQEISKNLLASTRVYG